MIIMNMEIIFMIYYCLLENKHRAYMSRVIAMETLNRHMKCIRVSEKDNSLKREFWILN